MSRPAPKKALLVTMNPAMVQGMSQHYQVVGMVPVPELALGMVATSGADMVVIDSNCADYERISKVVAVFKQVYPSTEILVTPGTPFQDKAETERVGNLGSVPQAGLIAPASATLESYVSGEAQVPRQKWNPEPTSDIGHGLGMPFTNLRSTGSEVVKQQVVTVWSPKGGVGKTFVAINLASAVSRFSGTPCVIIDLDLESADVGAQLDLMTGPGMMEALPYLEDDQGTSLERFLLTQRWSGLKVLRGPETPEMAALVKISHIQRLLQLASKQFNFVFIDTPPSASSDVAYECVERASTILLVTTQDVACLRQVRLATDILRRLGIDISTRVKLVINQLRPKTAMPKHKIESFLGLKATSVLPDDRVSADLAGYEGKSIVEVAGNTNLANEFKRLAYQICPFPQLVQGPKPKWRIKLWNR